MNRDDLRAAALRLSDQDRASLAQDLLDSLGPEEGAPLADPEWGSQWGQEIASRLATYETSGETLSSEEVMRHVRERLATLRG